MKDPSGPTLDASKEVPDVAQRFAPGFRCSVRDGIVIAMGTIATVLIAMLHLFVGLAIAWVLLHFFLFCNVFRIRRPAELVWAVGFAVLAISAEPINTVSWPFAFAVSVALAALLLAFELRAPSYHGVGWRRLNPCLPEWWVQQRAEA